MLLGLISTLAPGVLSAIGPLLQNAPELLTTFVDSPLRLFNAISEADRREQELTNQQIQNMLAQGNQALLFNLLMNRPGGAGGGGLPGGLPAGLAGLAGASSLRSRTFSTAGPRVDPRIHARLVPPLAREVGGRPTPLYRHGQALAFHLVLETAQPAPERAIPKAIAHLRIKDAREARLLLERRYQLKDLALNQPLRLDLPAEQAQRLPINTDLLVSVDVSWQGRSNQVYTTQARATQALYLTGATFLGAVGGRLDQEMLLRDPIRFRAFWHRIWEGGSAKHRRWEFKATSRYYYRLNPNETSNGRLDTKFKAVPERSNESESRVEWGGFLKSGMELAPGELNKLLPLMQDRSPWPEEELQALQTEHFARHVNQEASVDLELRGRSSERGSIWVFPVMDLVDVTLERVTATGPDGEVTATEAMPRVFPIPVSAVFVGMENES